MKFSWVPALAAIGLAGIPPVQAAETALEPMPADLETRFALSAAPPQLREQATVYLLDPGKGYYLSRQGRNGVTCVVERTAWELADFRNDIYIPLCYDAVGTKTYLEVIMDAATPRVPASRASYRPDHHGPDSLQRARLPLLLFFVGGSAHACTCSIGGRRGEVLA